MVDFSQAFRDNFHMDHQTFELLFSKIEKHLQPRLETRIDQISPRQRLAIALEYVDSIHNIAKYSLFMFTERI